MQPVFHRLRIHEGVFFFLFSTFCMQLLCSLAVNVLVFSLCMQPGFTSSLMTVALPSFMEQGSQHCSHGNPLLRPLSGVLKEERSLARDGVHLHRHLEGKSAFQGKWWSWIVASSHGGLGAGVLVSYFQFIYPADLLQSAWMVADPERFPQRTFWFPRATHF